MTLLYRQRLGVHTCCLRMYPSMSLTPSCLHAAERNPLLPRVASLQNAYSLTCRTFDSGLSEVCHLEGVGLMAYSPLAMGLLTVSMWPWPNMHV